MSWEKEISKKCLELGYVNGPTSERDAVIFHDGANFGRAFSINATVDIVEEKKNAQIAALRRTIETLLIGLEKIKDFDLTDSLIITEKDIDDMKDIAIETILKI